MKIEKLLLTFRVKISIKFPVNIDVFLQFLPFSNLNTNMLIIMNVLRIKKKLKMWLGRIEKTYECLLILVVFLTFENCYGIEKQTLQHQIT